MGSKKHTYIIAINQADLEASTLTPYKYGNTEGCVISISEDCAFARYTMGPLKTAEEAIQSNIAIDAMRRIHLYHAARYSHALNVESITVSIDDKSTTLDDSNAGFPYLTPMLCADDLDLPETWADPDFLEALVSLTESKLKDKLNFVCLYSVLAGSGKTTEMDRFVCNWTAMNAYYNHLVSCYRDMPDMAALPGNTQNALKRNNERLYITLLLRVLGCGGALPVRKKMDQFSVLTSSASQINSNDLDALYNDLYAHRTDPTYIPAGYDLNGRSLKSRLQKLLPDLNMSAYGCILLAYAYHMRCKFLHGNETPPLFLNIKKENEDISAFRMLNLFLERFLKAEIPQMFSTSWMDQTKCDAITNFLTSNDYTNFNANT